MRRWLIAFGLVLLSCMPIFMHRATGDHLLQDSDTAVLLDNIQQRHAPLSWFAGDWPLGNHFYRPISTLFFELDNALHPGSGAGFGLTQALISIACVMVLFWFVRELTDTPWIAGGSAAMFALWHVHLYEWLKWVFILCAFASLATFFLPKRRLVPALMGFLVSWTAAMVISPIGDIEDKVIAWLPGRTASVMTLFALIALAAYVRFERISAQRRPAPDPALTDPPATKGTVLNTVKAKHPWAWIVVAMIASMLAFGSYEQAVMLPACFLIVAVALRVQRYQVRWGWQAVAWGMLFGYLALRHALVPSDVSGYQAQQFRSGPGVWISLSEYLLPCGPALYAGFKVIGNDVLSESTYVDILMILPYAAVMALLSNVATYWQAKKEWLLPLTALLLSFVSYMPMAWLKYFAHYHYWPMAFRSLLAVLLMALALKTFANAASLPALRAPKRLDPAPGSLPHP